MPIVNSPVNSPVVFIAAMLVLLCCRSVTAADAVLTVTPDKCVALRKGQVCYQNLRLTFETSRQGDFCLFAADQAQPLQCFSGVSSGEVIYPFASEQAMEFNLTNAESMVLARAEITIAWVYKKSRNRNRWRLF